MKMFLKNHHVLILSFSLFLSPSCLPLGSSSATSSEVNPFQEKTRALLGNHMDDGKHPFSICHCCDGILCVVWLMCGGSFHSGSFLDWEAQE